MELRVKTSMIPINANVLGQASLGQIVKKTLMNVFPCLRRAIMVHVRTPMVLTNAIVPTLASGEKIAPKWITVFQNLYANMVEHARWARTPTLLKHPLLVNVPMTTVVTNAETRVKNVLKGSSLKSGIKTVLEEETLSLNFATPILKFVAR